MNAIVSWHRLSFVELSNQQLYALMQLRQEVFVVEQDCVYLDVDGYDQDAWHILGDKNHELVAYCRILSPGKKYQEASIGRVVTAKSARRTGLGQTLMQQALACVRQQFGAVDVRISAQLYLKEFYQAFNFNAVSQPYDEDGIPHIEMLYQCEGEQL